MGLCRNGTMLTPKLKVALLVIILALCHKWTMPLGVWLRCSKTTTPTKILCSGSLQTMDRTLRHARLARTVQQMVCANARQVCLRVAFGFQASCIGHKQLTNTSSLTMPLSQVISYLRFWTCWGFNTLTHLGTWMACRFYLSCVVTLHRLLLVQLALVSILMHRKHGNRIL